MSADDRIRTPASDLPRRRSRRLRPNAAALAVTLAAFVLLAAGCGGSAGGRPAGSIGDFADVQTSAPRVELVPGGTSAVVRVTTDPATICAVSFGTTSALGSIANDPGMGGTAITKHVVTLRGLKPDSPYHFVLTATDAHGRVYQTKPATFTTAAAASSGGTSADIARGARVVHVSSEFGSGYEAANAFDGDLSTEWSSAGDGDRASVTIDLGRARAIGGVAFRSRSMADGSAITRSFTVLVDGKKRLGPFPAGNEVNANIARVAVTGRVLRFDVDRSTGGNTGASEIEVYAAR